MNIQIYTDLEDSNYVLMDLSSLMHAYVYANKEENQEMESQLLTLFHEGKEYIRIAKESPIYTFLKMSPYTKEDEITWNTIKESYLIARLQNNTSILRILGKVLGHWEQYALDKKESDGLIKELVVLPEQVRAFILKYHDVAFYETQKREQVKPVKDSTTEKLINRSVVEIGVNKTYKKAA